MRRILDFLLYQLLHIPKCFASDVWYVILEYPVNHC